MQKQRSDPAMSKLRRRPQGLPPNAILEQTEATHQEVFSLMGETLLFGTNDRQILEAAEEAFGRFSPLPMDSEKSPLVLELFVHKMESEPAVRPTDRRPKAIYRTHGHLFYVSVGANETAVADLKEGYAFGFVTPAMARDRPTLRFVFLEGLALAMLGTVHQFIPLHAACVVRDGASITMLGSAGSGKSTLAYACVRRGYKLLSEDGLMVKCLEESARLWGMPWKLHLLPDSARFFPELEDEQATLQVNGEWKIEVDLESYPEATTTHAEPGLVLFLERGKQPGPTWIEPVPHCEALERLEVVWPWWVGWTEEMERQVPRFLERGSYRLHMDGTPDQAVDALDALLEE